MTRSPSEEADDHSAPVWMGPGTGRAPPPIILAGDLRGAPQTWLRRPRYSHVAAVSR
jgi:hypothetical protein